MNQKLRWLSVLVVAVVVVWAVAARAATMYEAVLDATCVYDSPLHVEGAQDHLPLVLNGSNGAGTVEGYAWLGPYGTPDRLAVALSVTGDDLRSAGGQVTVTVEPDRWLTIAANNELQITFAGDLVAVHDYVIGLTLDYGAHQEHWEFQPGDRADWYWTRNVHLESRYTGVQIQSLSWDLAASDDGEFDLQTVLSLRLTGILDDRGNWYALETHYFAPVNAPPAPGTPVPEPATVLSLLAFGGLAAVRCRRRR